MLLGLAHGRQSDSDESFPVLTPQVCIPSSAVLRVGHDKSDSHCGWKVGAQVACASPREPNLGSGTKKEGLGKNCTRSHDSGIARGLGKTSSPGGKARELGTRASQAREGINISGDSWVL